MIDRRTELRKLPPGPLYQLVQILESSSSWKQLMSMIPKSPNQPCVPKYKTEHIKLIERASETQRRPCSEIFLDEWGTSGQIRPTLETLLELLIKAELFRAAEFVATDLLKDSAPVRPETGPAANVDVSDETIDQLIPALASLDHEAAAEPDRPSHGDGSGTEQQPIREGDTAERLVQLQDTLLIEQLSPSRPPSSPAPSPAPPLATQLPHYAYGDLERYTDGFNDVASGVGGRKLGTGAFGSVYLAVMPLAEEVAVKRLRKDAVNVEKQFRNEVETLSKFRHPHLLPLLGYSCDGPSYCLVYQYMSGGSLQERLASKTVQPPLPWQLRVEVALGTSQGILHLHTAFDKPLIHRDVKTANILLDQNLVPKLGDFGLVRLGSNSLRTQSVAMTTTVFGTSAYMAPEAFRGDISVKIDTFSFGVVLLELLTSLPPYDENREGCDLVTHLEELCDGSIRPLLDDAAGDWGDAADALYAIALDCLEEKRRRPNMTDVVARLRRVGDVAAA